MLETAIGQAVAAMVAIRREAEGTELAGLAFSIQLLCEAMLENIDMSNTDSEEDN